MIFFYFVDSMQNFELNFFSHNKICEVQTNEEAVRRNLQSLNKINSKVIKFLHRSNENYGVVAWFVLKDVFCDNLHAFWTWI